MGLSWLYGQKVLKHIESISKVQFFKTAPELRQWFIENHETASELLLGYFKKNSGIPSVDWPQSVDEALCFGWIDGIRRSIDNMRYQIRFTPRNPKSHWSSVNLKKVEQLIEEGRMQPTGLAVWQQRHIQKAKQASYEQNDLYLAKVYEDKIKVYPQAWEFFNTKLAPSYKKASIHWIMSAKQEITRLRRLEILIASSAQGEKIPPLR